VRALLRAVVLRPEARRARRLSCFLFPHSPAVEHALKRSRFSLLRHAYLRLPLVTPGTRDPAPEIDGGAPPDCAYVVREWSPDIVPDLLTLLSAAYEGSRETRCFAPDGDIGQWATYVHQLAQTPACGRFERGLSFALETRTGEMAGAILVTALSAHIAHIAQMAVSPRHQRRGLGEWMVRTVCVRARQARYEAATLLVAESNQRARRLYDRLGFGACEEFLFADRVAGSR
jgi:ribosomal protein S18 acetylase RimI-like enzyme